MTYWLQAVAIGIGLFGVAASFSAQVLARRKEFGLLAHLGLTRRQILTVVTAEGAVWTSVGAIAGLGGTALGLVGGVLFASNVDAIYSALGLQLIPKGLYFIDYLPTDLRAGDVLSIGITAVVLAILATLYPSWRASRINPVECLRHE